MLIPISSGNCGGGVRGRKVLIPMSSLVTRVQKMNIFSRRTALTPGQGLAKINGNAVATLLVLPFD